MNRKSRLFLGGMFCISALLALLPGCSKPGKQPEANAAAETETGEDTVKPLLGVILTETSLLELKADGKVHWKANLSAGDTVGWLDEKKDITRAYDGQVRTFYRVNADGDYWVQDYAVAGPAEPVVIVEPDTVLYTRPDLTSPVRTGTIILPRYTLGALLPDDNPADNFVRISARLEGAANPQISERYVKIENISTDTSDVGAVKLVRIAAAAENAVVRMELLKNAMELARNGSRLDGAVQYADGDPALFELELTDNLEKISGQVNYIVTSDTVNVYNLPSATGGVLRTLDQGASFWVTAKTKRETALKEGESRGVWLRTEDGGWVFGASAVPNPAY